MQAIEETRGLVAINWRIRPEVRKAVKAGAVYAGITAEQYADQVLGEHMAARGLMPKDMRRETR